jgi:hypothetical protein
MYSAFENGSHDTMENHTSFFVITVVDDLLNTWIRKLRGRYCEPSEHRLRYGRCIVVVSSPHCAVVGVRPRRYRHICELTAHGWSEAGNEFLVIQRWNCLCYRLDLVLSLHG